MKQRPMTNSVLVKKVPTHPNPQMSRKQKKKHIQYSVYILMQNHFIFVKIQGIHVCDKNRNTMRSQGADYHSNDFLREVLY